MGLGDDAPDLGDHLGAEADLVELSDGGGVVEDSHDHLLARLRARGGDAEVDVAGFELGAEGAVLGLALLGDVHRREDLEDVQDRVAGGPVERLGGVEDAVDPVADRELFGGRFEVDVGRPPEHGVVNELLGGHVRLRLLGPLDALGVGLGRALALADEHDRRPRAVGALVPLVEDAVHPHLVHQAVGDLAEVVRREDLVVVGDRLVPDVDISEQRDEVRQEEQDHADRVDRDRPDQDQAEDAGPEDDRVPHLEPGIGQFLGVRVDPAGRPGPHQVDEDDGDELEQVQVEPRASGEAGRLPEEGEIAQAVGEGSGGRAEGQEGEGGGRGEREARTDHRWPFMGHGDADGLDAGTRIREYQVG